MVAISPGDENLFTMTVSLKVPSLKARFGNAKSKLPEMYVDSD